MGRLCHKEVQTLTLTDEGSSIRRHVQKGPLFDFPGRLEERLSSLRDHGNALNRSILHNNLILQILVPESQFEKVPNQMLVENDVFTGQGPSGINIGRERLKALIESQNLTGRGRRHGGD